MPLFSVRRCTAAWPATLTISLPRDAGCLLTAVIRHDVFSYTVYGKPWLVEEWGYALLLAWLVAHVGAVSYWLVSAGACCGALLLSVARWRKVGAGWLWTACLSIVAAAGMYLLVTPRPQDLSYLFFAALLLLLTLARQRTLWLLAVPPLLLIWANIHGSFLLGLGIIVLELIWSVFPRLKGRIRVSRARLPVKAIGLTLVGSLGATLANPHGPFLWTYAFKVSSSPVLTSLIAEWQSPDFHSLFLLAAVVGPVLLLLGLLGLHGDCLCASERRCARLLDAACHPPRRQVHALSRLGDVRRPEPMGSNPYRDHQADPLTIPVALFACAALLAGPHTPAGAPQRGGSMGNPVAATSFLKHQTGRLFTTYWWGDYMIYEGIPVFVDGRTDLYFGTDILETYTNVANAVVDPDPVLKRWDIRWVMWNAGSALTVYLSADPAWKVSLPVGRRCRLRAHRLLVIQGSVGTAVVRPGSLGRNGCF